VPLLVLKQCFSGDRTRCTGAGSGKQAISTDPYRYSRTPLQSVTRYSLDKGDFTRSATEKGAADHFLEILDRILVTAAAPHRQ
jgi:hypothetical protein